MKVLDHGYCNLVESWGSDERIIEAARMSTDKGFQGWGGECPGCKLSPVAGSVWQKMSIDDGMGTEVMCPSCKGSGTVVGDEKLLSYLWRNNHHTPFEMAGLTVEIQAPIFVVREWHRHRTQSYNELSGRYTQLPDLYYIPSIERLMAGKQSTKNKQSSEAGFTEAQANDLQRMMELATQDSRNRYERLLTEGVSRELARLVIPCNQFTRFRASANLRNWLAFLSLRLDPAAQWEIRQYATAVEAILQGAFPRTMALFNESRADRG